MNYAIVAHDSLRILFLITATGAVVTRFGSNLKYFRWLNNSQAKLELGHRYLGWIAIIAIMALLLWGGYEPDTEPGIIDRLIYLHIPLLLICSAAILYKSYKEEGNPILQDRMLQYSWLIISIFGALFTFVVSAMLIRNYELFPGNLPVLYTVPYSILVITHAGLAFGIIVVRNIQVRILNGGKTIRNWTAKKTTQPNS